MKVNSIKSILICLIALAFPLFAFAEGGNMINVLDDIPYQDEMMGKRKVVDEDHLLMMQIALKPEQQVPDHVANSNVRLLILEGSELTVTLNGVDDKHIKGDLVPVAYKTRMSIKNTGLDDATFLVMKTPNPSKME